jgi:hypothetical protein
MKKSNTLVISVIIIVIIILIAIFALTKHSSAPSASITPAAAAAALAGNNAPTVSTSTTQTVAVSGSLSKYQNDELGFTVQYPTAWAVAESPAGPLFTIPLPSRTTAISTLGASIYFASGKCAFPPVASSSIQQNTTVTAGGLSYKMISVKTASSGLGYFDRMYTLQQGTAQSPVCYIFSFASVTSSTNANNQSIISAADGAFTAMVKSFAFVTGPAGDSETAHTSGK